MENFYKIKTDSRYFVPLCTVSNYGFVSLVDASDEPHIIECILEPYEFSGFNYKLYAVPADPDLRPYFERRRFYTSDFSSLVKSGHIVEKTSDSQHVEMFRGMDHLYGAAYLIHEGEIIVES